MSPLTVANVHALIVLICEAYVLTGFITGYPTRLRDGRKQENVGECR